MTDARDDELELDDEHDESLVDRMRGSGVGVEDPNIVGDVGPVDVAPGSDGDPLIVEAEPGEEHTIRD